jgi:hypothetical protein
VNAAQYNRERLGLLRNRNQVDVIAHQAVSEDADTAEIAVHLQQFELDLAAAARIENDLAIGSALGNVVRHTGRD